MEMMEVNLWFQSFPIIVHIQNHIPQETKQIDAFMSISGLEDVSTLDGTQVATCLQCTEIAPLFDSQKILASRLY